MKNQLKHSDQKDQDIQSFHCNFPAQATLGIPVISLSRARSFAKPNDDQ